MGGGTAPNTAASSATPAGSRPDGHALFPDQGLAGQLAGLGHLLQGRQIKGAGLLAV